MSTTTAITHFRVTWRQGVNQTTQCNIPEEQNPQQQHCGNLKPYIWTFIW